MSLSARPDDSLSVHSGGDSRPVPLTGLSPEARPLVRDIVAALKGAERPRERNCVRSKIARMDAEYRAAENAKKAARERERYYANIDEYRRKNAAKRRARRVSRLPTSEVAPA